MKIVIAGGSGFIGKHASRTFIHEGHSVILLSRHTPAGEHFTNPHVRHIQWNGQTESSWGQECDGADIVINLSGAPIADSRWTAKRKQELVASRVESNKILLKAISSWSNKPHTLITASGIGFYGDRGEELVNEATNPGKGFLPQLCQMWENSAMEGEALKLRVIPLRMGMVLGADGGALTKMTFPFRFFLGGPILPGTQYVSWIHVDDLANLILFLICHPSIRGPVNAVAPAPVTMNDFCHELGKAMNRPSWLPVPGFALKTALGELASMLTTGQHVEPQKALQNNFTFAYPTLPSALHEIFSTHSPMKE